MLWESKINPAGFQNNLIKMTDAGILAPVMYLMKIDFIRMLPEVKGKITQQTDTENHCTDNASAYDGSYKKHIPKAAEQSR